MQYAYLAVIQETLLVALGIQVDRQCNAMEIIGNFDKLLVICQKITTVQVFYCMELKLVILLWHLSFSRLQYNNETLYVHVCLCVHACVCTDTYTHILIMHITFSAFR